MVGLLLAFTLLAAACGGDDEPASTAPVQEAPEAPEPDTTEAPEAPEPDTTEAPEAPEPLEEVELRFVLWDERQVEVHEQMIEAFQQDHPNISIDVEVI
ncbi:MAG: hypothetical protein OXC00_10045, partial [Acidimicrobiaceae bacterium]|nr:hypothetical protein [Acidimicrobiaceae bacterium]